MPPTYKGGGIVAGTRGRCARGALGAGAAVPPPREKMGALFRARVVDASGAMDYGSFIKINGACGGECYAVVIR